MVKCTWINSNVTLKFVQTTTTIIVIVGTASEKPDGASRRPKGDEEFLPS